MISFKICKVDNCGRQAVGHGFCLLHYKRFRRGSDMDRPPRGTLKSCTVDGCNRPILAMGLCNAHYIRKRKGADITSPIWERKIVCVECGAKINHGGQGRCQFHYRQYLKQTRNKTLIDLLGGICQICNKEYPIVVYDFHHRDPSTKAFAISNEILNKPMDVLMAEVLKCDLLCSNCHRILHYGGENEGIVQQSL